MLGEGRLVGTVLEVLLQLAGYEARRLFGAPDPERLDETLAGAGLVVPSSASGIKDATRASTLPTGTHVLELIRDDARHLARFSIMHERAGVQYHCKTL